MAQNFPKLTLKKIAQDFENFAKFDHTGLRHKLTCPNKIRPYLYPLALVQFIICLSLKE